MKTIEGRELIEWAQENDFNGTHVLDIKLITALRAELQSVTAHDKSSVSNWEFALKERDELRAELSALRARPQEPGLSQEWLDELIRGHSLALQNWSTFQSAWANYWRGIEWLRDAILSAPSGPLSDPEATKAELCKERGHHTYPDEPPWGHSLGTPLRCQVCGESTGPC